MGRRSQFLSVLVLVLAAACGVGLVASQTQPAPAAAPTPAPLPEIAYDSFVLRQQMQDRVPQARIMKSMDQSRRYGSADDISPGSVP